MPTPTSDPRSLQKLCGEVRVRTKTLQRQGQQAYLAGNGLFNEFMEAVSLADGKNENEAVRKHLPPAWEDNARSFLATHDMFDNGK